MTHQEFEERLDEILKDCRQALQQQIGLILDGRHRLDVETADKYLIETPKQAIRELFVDVVGADVDLPNSIMPKHGQAMQNILKRKLRTTITGEEGGDE